MSGNPGSVGHVTRLCAEMHYSEIANFYGIPNIPDAPPIWRSRPERGAVQSCSNPCMPETGLPFNRDRAVILPTLCRPQPRRQRAESQRR